MNPFQRKVRNLGTGIGTELTIRVMEATDVPDGLRLREAAGWNQTEADWLRLLELEPMGCFVACEGERVCGTVTTLKYGRAFGWIGMLLTDPQSRKRGIGTRLLDQAVTYLERSGVECIRLDGTPMGYNLYVRHGFVDEYEIQRWEGISTLEAGGVFPPVREADLEAICRWDWRLFGADRSRLIVSLWQGNSSCSAVAWKAGEIAGYALWRPGAQAWYLGPCLAGSADLADSLIREMLGRVPGAPVFVDICMMNPRALELLERAGFQYQRPLVRMYRGHHTSPGEPRSVYAIAGPELG